MEVNRVIYPKVEEISNIHGWYSNYLSAYPLNTDLEDSITYSASTSGYAPLCNMGSMAIYGSGNWTNPDTGYGEYRSFSDIKPVTNAVQKIHLIENTSGITSIINKSENKKFGYSASSLYSDRRLVCDYNFFYQTYCIRCMALTEIKPGSAYFSSMSIDEAFTKNYKIIGIYLEAYASSNNLATLSQLYDCTFEVDIAKQKILNQTTFPYIMYNTGYAHGITGGIQLFGSGGSLYFDNTDTGFMTSLVYNTNFAKLENPLSEKPNFIIPVFNGTKEDILHMAATVGVPFSDKYDILAQGLDSICSNDNVYIPIIEDNGLYQGNYASGEQEKRNTKQVTQRWDIPENWDAPWRNGVPDFADIDTREFGDDKLTGFGGQTAALTHRYLLNRNQMKQVADYLNTTDKNIMANIINKLKMNGENPINSVVSVQYVPIDIDSYMEVTGADVVIGSNLINIGTIENPVKLTSTLVTTDTISIDLGSAKIKAINKNFLDYEPYTKYVAYIPYCNFVELDASIITGHELSFELICDLLAGTCEGLVRVDGQMYKTVGGNFMTQCSVQGIDNSSYVNGIISSTGKMVSGAGAIIGATALGVVSKNVGMALLGIASGGATMAGGAYDFATTPKEYVATGKSIGLIGQYLPQHVCIYRYSCQDISDTNYGNFVGYACEFSAKLSSLSGLTVCHNPIINCAGNQTEIDEIKELLENGVII